MRHSYYYLAALILMCLNIVCAVVNIIVKNWWMFAINVIAVITLEWSLVDEDV